MKPRFVIAQIGAVVTAFVLDRITKAWVMENLPGVIVKPFINGFMQLHLTENTGAAFSLGRDNAGLMTIFATMVSAILIGWAYWRHKLNPDNLLWEKIGAGLVLGGAFGNLYDRFTLGRVTDFLQFTFIDFPIFNVADALIDTGVVLICLDILRHGAAGEEPESK